MESKSYKEKLYDEYSSQRDRLDDASLEAAGRYDRTFLTISTGALVLSVTFIDKMVGDVNIYSVVFLLIGWGLLLLAIVLQLQALRASQNATMEQIEILDKQYSLYFSVDDINQTILDQWVGPKNKYNEVVKRCNRWARRALILGVIVILGFSAINLLHSAGARKNEQKNREHISQINWEINRDKSDQR